MISAPRYFYFFDAGVTAGLSVGFLAESRWLAVSGSILGLIVGYIAGIYAGWG